MDPTIVFLHGVGQSPALFDPVADLLAPARCVIPTRANYRGGRTDHFVAMVAEVLELVDRHAPVVLVGVSGGATLALAAALHNPSELRAAVVHEPLIGPLADLLHRFVNDSARRLRQDDSEAGPVNFVRGLVGEATWKSMPVSARCFAFDFGPAIRAEVPTFLSFAPTAQALSATTVPITVSTGARSPAARHEVASILAATARAATRVIADAAHLAQWEQPAALAAVVNEYLQPVETNQ